MAKPVRTALIGYGYAGKVIHAPLIRAVPGLELTLIGSSRPDNVRADLPDIRVNSDYSRAVADPDIELVVIATPNDSHAPLAHEALDAGKHVVIDKPFALSVAEGESLIRHAERVGRHLSVFHCRRWDSNHLTFQALLPRFGDLYQVIIRFDRWRPQVRDRWREREGPGSGIWFDLGAHLIDQALTLFGQPDWIEADIAAQRPGASTDDYFHVVLAYGPLRVILHSSMMTTISGPAIEAQGARGGWIKHGLDTQEDMLKAGRTPGDAGWGVDLQMSVLRETGDGSPGVEQLIPALPGHYPGYYEGMAAAIRDNAPVPVLATDALKVMHLLEMGFLSAREGRRILL
ncbi:oxidoreductase [Asticcacaulis sp. EMRT-3]|uniref:oxidoreductase n=1 Tax=Asticcacaulis sp. EMRT-3 TaxID=3040349 RepID=UPI0024B0004F|nr:oxidoreductase [Asticcacaulis sp. EMRT-3]MDI7774299.1 oxidoreductase [Asticcacaulis sp. EMRT-3]